MFKRRWKWFGELRSDEGFTLRYGNRSVTYSDDRGSFQLGFEDGFLLPPVRQVAGKPIVLTPAESEQIVDRVLRGIRSEGHNVEVYSQQRN